MSSTSMKCQTPSSVLVSSMRRHVLTLHRFPSAANVTVRITDNNGTDWSLPTVMYRFTPSATPAVIGSPSSLSMSPVAVLGATPSLGSVSGGTRVHLFGTGFENSAMLTCFFGTLLSSPATFISSTSADCLTPAAGSPGTVKLMISNNG